MLGKKDLSDACATGTMSTARNRQPQMHAYMRVYWM